MSEPIDVEKRFDDALKYGWGIAKQLSKELDDFASPKELPRYIQTVGETYLRTRSFYTAILTLAEKRVYLQETESQSLNRSNCDRTQKRHDGTSESR